MRALPQAPELITLLELRDDPKSRGIATVVHQDPPLGEHLLDVLHRFAAELMITTPAKLLTAGRALSGTERPLADKVIGLSISDSPDLDRLGFHQDPPRRCRGRVRPLPPGEPCDTCLRRRLAGPAALRPSCGTSSPKHSQRLGHGRS